MDDQFLLPRSLEITVLTPVHIGTGDRLSHKSFVSSGKEIIVVDEMKLIHWAEANLRQMNEFMAFAEKTDAGLDEFFSQKRLNPQEFASYSIAYDSSGRPRDILTIIKTADGKPYLPGSSFKGSLRSALLRGILLSNPKLTQKIQQGFPTQLQAHKKHPGQEIEAEVFVPAKGVKPGKRPNFDLIRSIGFGDTAPVSQKSLQVVEVRVLSSKSNHTLDYKPVPNGSQPMRLYIETLKPGSKLQMPINLNLALLGGYGPADQLHFQSRQDWITKFPMYCKLAAANLVDQELAFYQSHHQDDMVEQFSKLKEELSKLSQREFILPIGWGTGYDAKTVTDQLGRDNFEAVVKTFKNTKRLGRPGGTGNWLGPDLSPKSRKVILHPDKTHDPIGWVHVRVTDRR